MNIAGLQRFTLSDYPGKISAIIFTQGCNFRCGYCHNPNLLELDLVREARVNLDDFLKKRQKQLEGIVISGGEPTIHKDLVEFIKHIKSYGYSIKLDTNGSNPQIIGKLLDKKLVDYIAMDIKAPLAKYQSICRVVVDCNLILESIKVITKSNVSHEFRTVLDGSLNDKDIAEIRKILPSNSKFLINQAIETSLE